MATREMTSDRKVQHSRAACRLIQPGSWVRCVHCDDTIKFVARLRHKQVVANVYQAGQWQGIEHFHERCYAESCSPYGDPTDY